MKSRKPEADPLLHFIIKLLLHIPPLFLLWYFLSPLLFGLLAPLLDGLLKILMSDTVHGVRFIGRELVFETLVPVLSADGRSGLATISLDPLKYCFSLPVVMGMILASVDGHKTVRRALWAYLVLLPSWLWSCGFWYAKTLRFDLAPNSLALLDWGQLVSESVALGYQFGALMLPSIAALLVWAWLCPLQVQAFLRVEQRNHKASSRAKTKRVKPHQR